MKYTDDYTEFKMLYKLSEQPYSSKKSYTTEKEFTPSFDKVIKEFIPTELARVQGIEPRLAESKSAVLPLDDTPKK